MSASAVSTTILAGLAVASCLGLARWYWTWLKKARLNITVELPRTGEDRVDVIAGQESDRKMIPSGSVSTASPSTLFHADEGEPVWARWYHLFVRNYGGAPARGCRGYLEAVYVMGPDGEYRHAPDWTNRVPLRWANKGNESRLDLTPGTRDRLDIFRGFHAGPVVEWVTSAADPGVQLLWPPGTYRVEVSVGHDGADDASCWLEVRVGQDYRDVEFRKVPHTTGSSM